MFRIYDIALLDALNKNMIVREATNQYSERNGHINVYFITRPSEAPAPRGVAAPNFPILDCSVDSSSRWDSASSRLSELFIVQIGPSEHLSSNLKSPSAPSLRPYHFLIQTRHRSIRPQESRTLIPSSTWSALFSLFIWATWSWAKWATPP